MSTALPEELPADFAASAGLLDSIVAKGLEKLLAEAKMKNYLEAPFGRKEAPTPLLSEEDFLTRGCLNNAPEEDEPVFKFEYGFNPLKFLAEYVRWSHPDSVKERRMERTRCVERLQFLAGHAKRQLTTSSGLRTLALAQGSGALWGPVTSVLSATSVLCVVQALRPGTLLVEVGADASFAPGSVERSVAHQLPAAAEGEELEPLSFDIDALRPNTKYYVRCHLSTANSLPELAEPLAAEEEGGGSEAQTEAEAAAVDESKDGEAAAAPEVAAPQKEELRDLFYAQTSAFWTPPLSGDEPEEDVGAAATEAAADGSSDDVGLAPITLACLPAAFSKACTLPAALLPEGCTVSCLLGDPFAHSAAAAAAVAAAEGEGLGAASASGSAAADAWGIHCQTQLMTNVDSVCRSSAMLLGWNDVRYGSQVDVRSEEVTFKQYEHDLKKYNKKHPPEKSKGSKHGSSAKHPPPVHNRPAMSASLAALVRAFPVRVTEEGSFRHLYKAAKLGPGLEVFCLDLRGGYLPKEQAKWLKDRLQSSTAIWKVVLTGAPVAIAVDAAHQVKTQQTRQRNKKSVAVSESIDLDTTTDGEAAAVELGAPGEAGAAGPAGSGVRVSLQEPAPSKHDDCDEHGRSKAGLHYMIASLQRAAERTRASMKQASADDASETGMTNAELTETVTAGSSTVETVAEDDVSVVRIDSGIVFVSSNAAAAGYPNAPFMATFDPGDYGRAYCAEVNIGAAAGSHVEAVAEENEGGGAQMQHHVVSNMSTKFTYNEEAVDPSHVPDTAAGTASEYSAVLRLEAEGDLSVRLLPLLGQGVGQALVQARFKLFEEEGNLDEGEEGDC